MSKPRHRNEIVLLEDDPATLSQLKRELDKRGILVHAFVQGQAALDEVMENHNIGALVVDIEIRYPYPDGPRNGMQGYDVANRILTDSATRLLSLIVMTALEQEDALDSANMFLTRPFYFSKLKWQKQMADRDRDKVFDEFAEQIKKVIELTPHQWLNEVASLYPKSRWIVPKKKGDKHLPPLWQIYRKLWMSPSWRHIEPQIGRDSRRILQLYLDGDVRQLRGDILNLTENPNEDSFQDYLKARRVIYALKYLDPAYWQNKIRGEAVEEEKPVLDAEIWQHISSQMVKELINKIHGYAAKTELEKVFRRYQNTARTVEKLEHRSESSAEDEKYKQLLRLQKQLADRIKEAQKTVDEWVKTLALALEKENEEVQSAMVPFLRFWHLDFTRVEWAHKAKKTGGQDPLTQLLVLLGVRKQDIEGDDMNSWRLLLPEERKWLYEVRSELEQV